MKITKITKDKMKNHLHYHKLIYLAAIILVVVLINFAYTATTPKIPKENRVSIMLFIGNANETVADEWEKQMLATLSSDQKEVEIISTTMVEISSEAIIFARISVNMDDIILLDFERMTDIMGEGAFIPLEEYLDLENIKALYPDIDWSLYSHQSEEYGEKDSSICMLPLDAIEGIHNLEVTNENVCIGILRHSTNKENAAKCVEFIMDQTEYTGELS